MTDDGSSIYGQIPDSELHSAFRSERKPSRKFDIGVRLARIDPGYLDEVVEAGRVSLAGDDYSNAHHYVAEWMIDNLGKRAVPHLVEYMSRRTGLEGHAQNWIVLRLVRKLGADGLPILLAGLDACGDTPVSALSELISIDDGTYSTAIRARIQTGLTRNDPATIGRYIEFARRQSPEIYLESLWALAEDRSKPTREAAARALGAAGDQAVQRAAVLLESSRALCRLSAATILASVGSARALAVLDQAVDTESDDEVREVMLAALVNSWDEDRAAVFHETLLQRAERLARKGWRTAAWMCKLDIPQLAYSDGSPVPPALLLYAMARQQKMPGVEPSRELADLFEHIDRGTSADYALGLLRTYVASGADAKQRWVLTIAGLLGDERLAAEMASHIRKWVDEGRGKLAEYGVRALALNGTDRALLAIDSLAMRYRNKMRNVGAAAQEAFAEAARLRGVSVDELGDRVVPELGFSAARTHVFGCGGRTVQATIGLDFKLKLFDLSKGKSIASLPARTPDSVAGELKELRATLRDVAKAQSRRLENLMVQQRRWPVSDWTGLFLEHPVMTPFGVLLVWGAYDERNNLVTTFRACEDGVLTSYTGERVELEEAYSVGIVHPLELEEPQWMRWMDSLTAIDAKAPFQQLDRPVVTVEPQQVDHRFYGSLNGTEMNGLTFKGRAERRGWRRGSVCDAGSITAYVKSYPAAQVDAFVLLQYMFVGMDTYSEIALGQAFFVRGGSVKIGGYEYDEPETESDPRLIRLGDVPRIVYSETIGDLHAIARASTDAED